MFEHGIEELISRLGSAISVVLIGLVILGLFSIALYIVDREGFRRARDWLWRLVQSAGAWLSIVLVGLGGLVVLSILRSNVSERFRTQEHAVFSRFEDPAGGQTVQMGPSVMRLEERTLRRTLTLPPSFLNQIDRYGLGPLAGYLDDPSIPAAEAIADRFQQSGRDVVFSRDVTLQVATPIALERSFVTVDFDFATSSDGHGYYRAAFTGKYEFENPLDEPVDIRFVFPLPSNSGTLSDFEMRVRNDIVHQADLEGGYVWEAKLASKERVEITVKYRNQGANTWTYDLGTRREPIRNFQLTVEGAGDVRFARGSLYPTSNTGNLVWKLENVITSQNIALGFPEYSLRETLTKVFSFAPLALLGAMIWIPAFAWRYRLALKPTQLMLAFAALVLGLIFSAILGGYISPSTAGIIGASIGTLLAILALGTAYALPLALSSIAPLCFFFVGNAGLFLAIILTVALLSLLELPKGKRYRGF